MRNTAIALLAPLLLLPAAFSASACPAAKLTMAQAAVTTELSADTADKKKAPKKAKKEKVEYMRSAAPPEPTKK